MSQPANKHRPLPPEGTLAAASPASQRLPSAEVALLRQTLHQHCPRFIDGALVRLVQQAFARDEVVEAYFYPLVQKPAATVAPGVAPVILIPFEQARRAALRAQQMAVLATLGPFVRHLAALAAMLYPCGWFLHAHPAFAFPSPDFQPDDAYGHRLSYQLLQPALQGLRGNFGGEFILLSSALGFSLEDSCNNEVVARVSTAVYLANLRVTAMWRPA